MDRKEEQKNMQLTFLCGIVQSITTIIYIELSNEVDYNQGVCYGVKYNFKWSKTNINSVI